MHTTTPPHPTLTSEFVDALFQAQNAAALLARLNRLTIPGTPIDPDQTAAMAAYIAEALDRVIDAVTE